VLCFALASYIIYMKFTGVLGGLLLGERGVHGPDTVTLTAH
jgi:hypothetical protein